MTKAKDPADLQKRGPKPKYDPDYHPRMIRWLARDGATDDEISSELGIDVTTFYRWKKKYPEICHSLKSKNEVDFGVEDSLLKRAMGFEFEEVKVVSEGGKPVRAEKTKKYIPPDAVAAMYWLNNRRRGTWAARPASDEIELARLQIERERLELSRKELEIKTRTGSALADAIANANVQVKTLAEMILSPQPNRNPADFENEQAPGQSPNEQPKDETP